MSAATSRPSGLSWLYTNNPFYVISAMLMLYGVRAGYGKLEIESINCWVMLGVLATYTLVLAGIGVAIVRWGKVWDDARSLLLVLLLLFLAVSISADDLFVKSESSIAGAALMLGGFIGSAGLSEVVLRLCRIRMGWLFRGPYHLLLALFFLTPWYCSPALHPRRSLAELEWIILLFPTVAAGLFALLLPAVRRGAAYVEGNGTPWPWPRYPWTMFAVIAAAVSFRSFVLSLTFAPHGPTWNEYSRTIADINFATIFGPYFLVPLAFVLLWLALEGAIVAGSRPLQRKLLVLAPLLLLFAYPYHGSDGYAEFLTRFTARCGSPLWISVCLLLVLYSRAWMAGAPQAQVGWSAVLLLLAAINRHVVFIQDVSPSNTIAQFPWPLLVVGGLTLWQGVHRRSALAALTGASLVVAGLWFILPEVNGQPWRMTICFHLLWGAVMAIGLLFAGEFARALRGVAAVCWPLVTFVLLTDHRVEAIPSGYRIAYLAALGFAVLALIFWVKRRVFVYALVGQLLVVFGAGSMTGYQAAVAHFGRPAMATMLLSTGALLIGVLISARKANWLPPDLFFGSRGEAPLVSERVLARTDRSAELNPRDPASGAEEHGDSRGLV